LYSESPWFESRPGIQLTNFVTSLIPSSQVLEQCNIQPSILTDTSQLITVFDKASLYKLNITVRHSDITCIPPSVRMRSQQTLRISSKTQNDFYEVQLRQCQPSPGHVNSRIMRVVICLHCDEAAGGTGIIIWCHPLATQPANWISFACFG
jgi:hypothetical protein